VFVDFRESETAKWTAMTTKKMNGSQCKYSVGFGLFSCSLPAARREVDDNRVRVRMKPIIYALVKYIVAMNRQRATLLLGCTDHDKF